MKTKAYLYIKKIAIKFIKENLDLLLEEHKNKDFSENILKELRNNDEEALEWVLGEILVPYFKELNYVKENDWGQDENEHIHTTIYQFGRKYIRETFVQGKYLIDHKFEFVKPVAKRVIIYTYEPIKQNENKTKR